MPTIRKTPYKHKKPSYKHENKSSKYYGMKQWKELRNTYIDVHPLCEVCLMHDTITPATEVHHRTPFLEGETDADRIQLLLDETNLMSVCRTCHEALHLKRKRYKMHTVDSLTDKEYNKAHNVLTFND